MLQSAHAVIGAQMSADLITTDEQAKALQEAFKLAGQSIEAAKGLGGYIADVLGTIPQDLVGYVMGDRLHHARQANALKLEAKTEELHRKRGVKETAPVSPSLALPLMQAAIDESQDDLLDLWARLLAAAMDPNRQDAVRTDFIETIKKFSPWDARVFDGLDPTITMAPNTRDFLVTRLLTSSDRVELSLIKLIELRVAFVPASRDMNPTAVSDVALSPYGRELRRTLNA